MRRRNDVLVVDDDLDMVEVMELVLKDAGYDTTLAADGDDAIAISASAPDFHLLITDEMMPRMMGHQLARYMREHESRRENHSHGAPTRRNRARYWSAVGWPTRRSCRVGRGKSRAGGGARMSR